MGKAPSHRNHSTIKPVSIKPPARGTDCENFVVRGERDFKCSLETTTTAYVLSSFFTFFAAAAAAETCLAADADAAKMTADAIKTTADATTITTAAASSTAAA